MEAIDALLRRQRTDPKQAEALKALYESGEISGATYYMSLATHPPQTQQEQDKQGGLGGLIRTIRKAVTHS